jgi:uncharacterized membrane-anchored protein
MAVLQRNPTLTRKPILPSWCDCHLFSIRQTIVFFSIFRAVLTLGALIFCTVVLIVVNDIQLDTHIFLVIIGTVNGIHLVIVGYFIYATKTSNCSIKKLWLIADIVLSIVISAFALFCTVPSNFYITVGVKLMALSVILCLINLRMHHSFLEQSLQTQNTGVTYDYVCRTRG